MLRTVAGRFGCHFGLKCSSLCKMNIGTSHRSACTALGYESYPSVSLANMLLERRGWCGCVVGTDCRTKYVWQCGFAISSGHRYVCKAHCKSFFHNSRLSIRCRTCCLILLATCLGGAWSLEQPSGSLWEFYPAWRQTIRNIFDCGGPFAVGAILPNTMLYNLVLCWVLKYFIEPSQKSFLLWVRNTGLRFTKCDGGCAISRHQLRNGMSDFQIRRP